MSLEHLSPPHDHWLNTLADQACPSLAVMDTDPRRLGERLARNTTNSQSSSCHPSVINTCRQNSSHLRRPRSLLQACPPFNALCKGRMTCVRSSSAWRCTCFFDCMSRHWAGAVFLCRTTTALRRAPPGCCLGRPHRHPKNCRVLHAQHYSAVPGA